MKNKNGFAHIILIIILVVSVVAAALFWRQYTITRQEDSWRTYNNFKVDPTADWKTYTISTVEKTHDAYQIKYPSEWKLSVDKDSNTQRDTHLSLTKGNYQLSISWPEAYGPSVCIFSDSPDFGKTDIPKADCPGKFTDFNSNTNTYRRLNKPFIIDDVLLTHWSIYTKDTNGFFVTVPPIQYVVPQNYDEKIITEMDEILSTFNKTNPEEISVGACTMDAKQCPDGTYVGRQGPKCEFVACP